MLLVVLRQSLPSRQGTSLFAPAWPFAAIAMGIRALSILLALSHLLPSDFACAGPFAATAHRILICLRGAICCYRAEPTLLIVVSRVIAPRPTIFIVVSCAEAIHCHQPRPTLLIVVSCAIS